MGVPLLGGPIGGMVGSPDVDMVGVAIVPGGRLAVGEITGADVVPGGRLSSDGAGGADGILISIIWYQLIPFLGRIGCPLRSCSGE